MAANTLPYLTVYFLNNRTRFITVHYQIFLFMMCIFSEITNGLRCFTPPTSE